MQLCGSTCTQSFEAIRTFALFTTALAEVLREVDREDWLVVNLFVLASTFFVEVVVGSGGSRAQIDGYMLLP